MKELYAFSLKYALEDIFFFNVWKNMKIVYNLN
jgi:hypothetical protein